MLRDSPVRGFHPWRSGRSLVVKVPKPAMGTVSSCARASLIDENTSSSTLVPVDLERVDRIAGSTEPGGVDLLDRCSNGVGAAIDPTLSNSQEDYARRDGRLVNDVGAAERRYALARAVIAIKEATRMAMHAAQLGHGTGIPVSGPRFVTSGSALPDRQAFGEHTTAPSDFLKESAGSKLIRIAPEAIVLNDREEGRSRSIPLTVESIVRRVAIAADEQDRKAHGAMRIVMLIIALENDKQGIRDDVCESVEPIPQLGHFDVRRPAAGAQDGLRHLLLMLDDVASKPVAFNPMQVVSDGNASALLRLLRCSGTECRQCRTAPPSEGSLGGVRDNRSET